MPTTESCQDSMVGKKLLHALSLSKYIFCRSPKGNKNELRLAHSSAAVVLDKIAVLKLNLLCWLLWVEKDLHTGGVWPGKVQTIAIIDEQESYRRSIPMSVYTWNENLEANHRDKTMVQWISIWYGSRVTKVFRIRGSRLSSGPKLFGRERRWPTFCCYKKTNFSCKLMFGTALCFQLVQRRQR